MEEKNPILPDVVAQVREHSRQYEAAFGDWRKEARSNYGFVAGDQWDPEDADRMRESKRVAVSFNFAGKIVDAVSGHEINNRNEVKYLPRELGDAGVNELLTSAAKWVRDNCNAEDEESDAFLDVLVSGVGCTETRMDYEEDPEGECLIERRDPLEMGWDPTARKRNLADAKWVYHKKLLTHEEIELRWPDKADEIVLSPVATTDDEDESPHVSDPRTAYDGKSNGLVPEPGKSRYEVVREQWYETICEYRVLDPVSQQLVTFGKDEFEVLEERTEKIGIKLNYVRQDRREYKQAFVCGTVVLEEGLAPCQKGFSFQFITGKRDRNKKTWYGLVRPMVDPQKWANKFFSQILHIINTNSKGGVMLEKGAAADPRKFKEDWAKSDSVVEFNPGALSGGKVQPKPAPQMPMAMSEMMQFSINAIMEAPGVNAELLGMVDRSQAGVLEQQRTQAGLNTLSLYFDSLRLYRKRQGKILAYYITEYLSDGRLIRIAGPSGERYVPLLKQPETLVYDVIVDQSPVSRDIKERTFSAFMQMLPMLERAGVPPPSEVWDSSPLPASVNEGMKRAFQEAMNNPQKKQMQEMMEQVQAKLAQLDVALKEVEIQKTSAETNKINADAELSEAKTVSEAVSIIRPPPQRVIA